MSDFVQNMLRFYTSMRELVDSLRPGGQSGRSVVAVEDVLALGAAFARGDLDIGCRVTGRGWLSPYAYWYLPKSYSPYHFHSDYAQAGDRLGVRMNTFPALLPAGQIPFERDGMMLGFLYPIRTSGFTLQLANPPAANIPTPQIDLQSPDDQPWVFNMDNGFANYSPNPQQWVYGVGETALLDRIPLSGEPSIILTDPARVREVVEVPDECKPIPILFPRGYCSSNRYVEFTARLMELDSAVLGELNGLGAPLTQKVYSLFYQPHSGRHAYCLAVDGDKTRLSHIDASVLQDPPAPKYATLMVEFFFENARGELLTFGDKELLELVIPSMKNHVYHMNGVYVPDRWLGKIYGFEGPVYIIKSGHIQMSISPSGTYCAYTTVDLNVDLPSMLPDLEQYVQKFQRNMLALYQKRMGKTVEVRTTYLTNKDWQGSFGKLLEGQAFEEAARRTQQFYALRQELQAATPQNAITNNGIWVNSPVQQATNNSSQTVNNPPDTEE